MIEFTETESGIFKASSDNGMRFKIQNCHIKSNGTGINFYLSVGKLNYYPIGDFWSLDLAKDAANNINKFIGDLI